MSQNAVYTPEAKLSSATTAPPAASLWSRLWSIGQFLLALSGTTAFLVFLLLDPLAGPIPPVERVAPPSEIVTIVGPGLIHVRPGSPFDQKIQVTKVRQERLTEPILTITGRVVASLRPGLSREDDYWQFDSVDTLTAFNDWKKAQADISFLETQLEQAKQLASARVAAQQALVKRLEKLVEAGTDTLKDLAAERANLIQVEITGRQEVHQAETALRAARREEAIQARKLQQAGLSIELLRSVTSEVDIVMADVPEGRLSQVHIGQGCVARFLGLPKERFPGRVQSIANVLSTEKRSLRVLFTIDDPDDKLRPGMFAEIGLGTDPREALLVPADALLHIGRADYVLVADGENVWRVAEVQVGDPYRNEVQILDGLRANEQIIGRGAILLKPLAVRALQVSEGPR
ncbi:MAG: efflux RND transporter periplasmic adaptor subunit [Gemmatales bacterium]|nr:efflux RND transporter periplasmic adaptor subunit [Gemmatales bacterium]MDW8386030.1 efflux RND transporter periplasmic adaptor subunit [Gemmatales bacterium]